MPQIVSLENNQKHKTPADFVKDESIPPLKRTDWNLSTKDDLKVLISPNPTNGIINVSILEDNVELCAWQLLDGNGRVMIEGNAATPNFNLDLSVYANGNYYLIIQTQAGVLVQSLKLIKQ